MKDTRQEILRLGEMFVRSKGFNSFSYKDISEQLNIKNAAIHYHFPSKADLGVAIIENTVAEFDKFKKSCQVLSPKERIEAFINIYDASKEKNWVCLMGALSPAHDTLPVQMQVKLQLMAKQIIEWMCTVLEEGRNAKVFHFKEGIRTQAYLIVTSLLSSLLIYKVLSNDVFESVKKGILNSL